MKKRYLSKSVAVAFVMVILLAAAIPALGAPDKARVFVSFAPGAKSAVQHSLAGAGAEFHYTFDDLSAFVVTVPSQALNGLVRNPNITSIEEDPLRYPVSDIPNTGTQAPVVDTVDRNGQIVPWGVDAVQARDVWDANHNTKFDKGAPTGEGVTVCIIDTGYYTEHEDLAGADLIGGFSQVDDDYTRDGYGHGTHVAGTIAAQNNKLGVVGVAPEVSLYIVKIFADDGSWVLKQHASDLVAAANDCAANGANIISMSLSGTTASGKERMAFDKLYAQGILSIAAASNDGIDDYHYPASYDSVVSVAALDESLAIADFSQYNDQVELAAPGVGVLSTIPYVETNTVTVEGVIYSANHIEYAAQGQISGSLVDGGLCTTTGAWTGMVVLCERGEISFYEKVMNVQNSGGAAAVIYNNAPGNFLGTLGDGNSSEIIAVSISQEDGQYLAANKLGAVADIYSQVDWPASGYEAWDGTSMATPHVSAVAALLWNAFPTATNVEIRQAMNATALDLGDPGRDVYYGFGLVQAADAIGYLSNLVP